MAELLSQQEIDNLLNNIKDGDVSEILEDKSKEAVPFDFRLPNRISKNQLRSIRNIHENFAESFSSFLVTKLQTIVNINVTQIDQLYYSEYVLSVANPACLYTFAIKDTDIKGIVELETNFAFSLVDRLLGGKGDGTKENNVITPIEQRVLVVIIDSIMKELSKAWSSVEKLTFNIDRFESDIDFAQITSPNESVLLVSFEVIVDEKPFMLNLCYATFAFERILSNLNAKSLSTIRPTKYKAGTARDIMSFYIKNTELNISVELGKVSLSFRDILNLEKGDIIQLNKPISDECVVKVENIPMFKGRIGVVDEKKAVKITKKIPPEEQI